MIFLHFLTQCCKYTADKRVSFHEVHDLRSLVTQYFILAEGHALKCIEFARKATYRTSAWNPFIYPAKATAPSVSNPTKFDQKLSSEVLQSLVNLNTSLSVVLSVISQSSTKSSHMFCSKECLANASSRGKPVISFDLPIGKKNFRL